jgi:hypothetical protein
MEHPRPKSQRQTQHEVTGVVAGTRAFEQPTGPWNRLDQSGHRVSQAWSAADVRRVSQQPELSACKEKPSTSGKPRRNYCVPARCIAGKDHAHKRKKESRDSNAL